MRLRVFAFTVSVLAAALLAACGRAGDQDPQAGVEIAFRGEPDPPRMGQNAFEVTVRDERGAPVTDAEVAVEFYMPAMPEMEMPEMRDRTTLQHEAGGVYRGTGHVIMAGDWEVTVTATRNGTEIGRHTVNLTAQP